MHKEVSTNPGNRISSCKGSNVACVEANFDSCIDLSSLHVPCVLMSGSHSVSKRTTKRYKKCTPPDPRTPGRRRPLGSENSNLGPQRQRHRRAPEEHRRALMKVRLPRSAHRETSCQPDFEVSDGTVSVYGRSWLPSLETENAARPFFLTTIA